MTQASASPLLESLLSAPTAESGVGWLDAVRRQNREAFAAGGLPGAGVEAWKYTALRALARRTFVTGDEEAQKREIDAAALTLPGVEGPRLVFVNGIWREDLSSLDAVPEGLTLQPLSQALQSDPEPLRFALSHLYQDPGEAFARLNAAAAVDGVVLRVAAGVEATTPVQLVFAGADAEDDLAWHVRNVIVLEEGARLDLIEHHLGRGEHRQLITTVSDIEVQPNARLRHLLLQNAGSDTSLIRRSSFRLHAGAEALLHLVELGGGLARHDLRAALVGNDARLATRGVFMPHARQHIDTQLAIRHEGLNTTSSSVWRGVASDRGRGVFRGAINVAPGADGSDASLSNKNLLLSPGAEIDTKPELEIHADEVQAAHGATVGQLDERSLFYMRSRGIPLADARSLLTAAFCRAVLDDLPNEELRDHLSEQLLAQLPAA